MIGDMGMYRRRMQEMIDDRETRAGNIGLRIGAMPLTPETRKERDRLADKMNDLFKERHELQMRYLISFGDTYP